MRSSLQSRGSATWGRPLRLSRAAAAIVAGASLVAIILAATTLVLAQLRAGLPDVATQSIIASALVSTLAVTLFVVLLLRQMQERESQLAAERQQAAALAAEKLMLEAIAGSSSPDVLETICRAMEAEIADSSCSILLLDADGEHLRHGAGPSLPKAYCDAVDGVKIGPAVGSCGTAAFLDRRVIVTDIASDPLWGGYRDLAMAHGLRACWSTPIHSASGAVLGTFAIYYRRPGTPTPADLNWAERATHLAGIAIERLQAEEAMAAAKEEAQSANRAKSVFLANMSHELRTPLNAIIGFSEGLGAGFFGDLSRAQHAYLRDIRDAGRHLLGLISDLLDMSQIDAGRLQLADDSIDLGALLADCIGSLDEAATARGVLVVSDLPRELPQLRGDTRRVRQILFNLLSNAIKFSPAGARVTIRQTTGADGNLAINVIDAGIGMTPAEIALALEPFRQGGASPARPQAGTGLGLPLANQLIELHGGRLEIESVPGQGTIVRALFPAERVTHIAGAI